jgi:hypothetical protein
VLIEDAARTKREKSHGGRWIAIAGAALLCALAIAVVVLVHVFPFTKKALTDALQNRSARTVEIGRFRRTWLPPGCVAEDVRFLRQRHPDQTPVLTIPKLVVRTNYPALLTFRRRVDVVVVVGMRVLIPPKQPDGKSQPIPLTEGQSKTSFTIGRIVADDAVLDFMPAQPGKAPYRLKIQHLTLTNVGAGSPMSYRTTLVNPKPPGTIEAEGKFGPWLPNNPSQTPVSGSFRMDHADLGISHLVSGILAAQGTFHGTLAEIQATGSTDIPSFHVADSGHRVHLSTNFMATVNGTNGDTVLRQVKARVEHTDGFLEGSVAGKSGKTISLDMSITDGRLADLLRIFIEAPQAPMDGIVSLKGKVTVPPGSEQFLRKLVLAGDFGIGGEHFANPATQTPISRLSESAQGERPKDIQDDTQIVLGNLKGHVEVKNGVATLSGLSFSVPGALARMNGTFNLVNKQVDIHGVLETSGNLSDATTGFKALVVKAITPFFKKKQSMRIVPFRITGPYGHTHIGLDGKL